MASDNRVLTRHEWRGAPIELGNVIELEKAGQRLICRLMSHPLGWELRLERDSQLLRSQACKTEEAVFSTMEDWRRSAEDKGWTAPHCS